MRLLSRELEPGTLGTSMPIRALSLDPLLLPMRLAALGQGRERRPG